jgi:multimeric flavodoxin WrbA
MPAAQFKALWDATGGLWQKGALAGKSVGVFFSTASQGGGQETTAFTCEPTTCMTAACRATVWPPSQLCAHHMSPCLLQTAQSVETCY